MSDAVENISKETTLNWKKLNFPTNKLSNFNGRKLSYFNQAPPLTKFPYITIYCVGPRLFIYRRISHRECTIITPLRQFALLCYSLVVGGLEGDVHNNLYSESLTLFRIQPIQFICLSRIYFSLSRYFCDY